MSKVRSTWLIITGLSVLFSVSGCASIWGVSAEPVMSAAVSADGRYALTAHGDNQLFVWDLDEKSRERISQDANIYSAAVAPESSVFLWQNLDGEVVLAHPERGEKERFHISTETYGHTITHDRQTYLFSDIGWGLYRKNLDDGEIEVLKVPDGKAFLGYGTILNLGLAEPEEILLTSGHGLRGYASHEGYEFENQTSQGYRELNGLTLWNLEQREPFARLEGNSVKTHATISPDGQWVVSGDENGKGFFWNTEEPEERHRMARYYSGIFLEDTPYEAGDPRNRDDSELIEAPSGVNDQTLASAFIHESQYFLRFGNNSHKAALFEAGNPWPQKYFDLGDSPRLVTYGSQYSRNTAIATAPEAGVLVMGHQSGGGISVYEFDAEAFDMERVWVVP